MNFSGISQRSLVGRLLRFPLKLFPDGTEVRILQGTLRGKKWIIGSGVHGYWLGSFEYDKRRLFERLIKKGDVVYDIGAHVGFYTILSAELVGATGYVYAFEPLPINFCYLNKHIEINKISNVELIHAAVYSESSRLYIKEGPESSMGQIAQEGDIKVESIRLDDFALKGEVQKPDFIKIDVEGAELHVLEGMENIIESFQPTISLATHGYEVHKKCIKLLLSFDYEIRAIDGKDIDKSGDIIASRH